MADTPIEFHSESYLMGLREAIDAINSLPPLIKMPDVIVPPHEIYDDFNLPTGIVAPESRRPISRLCSRQDYIDAIEELAKNVDKKTLL